MTDRNEQHIFFETVQYNLLKILISWDVKLCEKPFYLNPASSVYNLGIKKRDDEFSVFDDCLDDNHYDCQDDN